MKLFKQIFTCLISSLALLSGCTKEPTMFEKCFVAEQEKLEELPDQILYARYGYLDPNNSNSGFLLYYHPDRCINLFKMSR